MGAVIFLTSILVAMAVVLVGDSGPGFSKFSEITSDNVAVIPLKGEITESSAGEVGNMLKEALDDGSVKAIVLDIDSPGGSVIPSKELMYKVRDGKSKKPIVARIGESGASGAYYTASAANMIIADEDSITGSIGVEMILIQYYGLFDKLGINATVIKSGERKDIGSPYREMTPKEEERLQEIINKIYYHFISDVAENRNMTISDVKKIATGDIYLGSEAKENGLVDKTGNLNDAINTAAELGGIKGEPNVKYMSREPTFYDIFAQGATNIGYGIGKAFIELSGKQGSEIKV